MTRHDTADLAGVGLGAGHPNLGPGVDVDTAVSLPGDGAAHRVGHSHQQRALGGGCIWC